MTSLNKAQKTLLKRYLTFLEEELEDLPRFQALSYADYSLDRDTRRNVERLCENLVNASIDIGKILLASERRTVPNSYRQVFQHLEHAKIIPPDVSQRLQMFTRIRNLLAHDYLDVRWEHIQSILDHGGKAFNVLIHATRETLRQSEEVEEHTNEPM